MNRRTHPSLGYRGSVLSKSFGYGPALCCESNRKHWGICQIGTGCSLGDPKYLWESRHRFKLSSTFKLSKIRNPEVVVETTERDHLVGKFSCLHAVTQSMYPSFYRSAEFRRGRGAYVSRHQLVHCDSVDLLSYFLVPPFVVVGRILYRLVIFH